MCYDYRIIGLDARTHGMGRHLNCVAEKKEISIVTETNEVLIFHKMGHITLDLFSGKLSNLRSHNAIEHANAMMRKANGFLCSIKDALGGECGIEIKAYCLTSHYANDLQPEILYFYEGLLLREHEVKKMIEPKRKSA